MDEQNLEVKGHNQDLEVLEKLEKKLKLIADFYENLEILRQSREQSVINLMQQEQIEPYQKNSTMDKHVIFSLDYLNRGRKSTMLQYYEKKKTVLQVYDLLGQLSSYHKELDEKISEWELIKNKNNTDFETTLLNLRSEKDEIDNKIIEFVIKNVVEGKEELFSVIASLEEDNKDLEQIITLLEKRVNFLKGTIQALLLENQTLMDHDKRYSDVVRRSIAENVSFILPMNLRLSSSPDSVDLSVHDPRNSSFYTELVDKPSVERSIRESFVLDQQLASWSTDEASTLKHVKRIGKNYEAMEITQMRLNLLKSYVQKHGAKYINGNTYIDPSRGTLWHVY